MKPKMTVEETIKTQERKEKKNGINRYSEKRYSEYALALINDTDFHTNRYVLRDKEQVEEKVYPSKQMKKFLKGILMQLGMSKMETAILDDEDFVIKNVDGLIDFIKELNYLYLEQGNEIKFPDRKDFQGSIYLTEVPEKSYNRKSINPKTGEVLGDLTVTVKEHKELKANKEVPDWLIDKEIKK
jgi:hypothetical protein